MVAHHEPIPLEQRGNYDSEDISPAGYLIKRRYYTVIICHAGWEFTLKISLTNHKLEGIILNTGSATCCCEFKAGFCQMPRKSDCYAYARECQFPVIAVNGELQRQMWLKVPAWKIANAVMDCLGRGKRIDFCKGPQGWVKLRYNERGGIEDQEMLEKMDAVAWLLWCFFRSHGIRLMAQTYTSRPDLEHRGLRTLTLKKSGTDGPAYHGRFVVFDRKEDVPDGYVLCRDDCRICAHCHVKGRDVAGIKHSGAIAQAKARALAA